MIQKIKDWLNKDREEIEDPAKTPLFGLSNKQLTLILSVIFVVCAVGLIGVAYFFASNFINHSRDKYIPFNVVSFYPQGRIENVNSPIKIEFTHPVTPHHIKQYIYITNAPEGDFKQGKNRNEVIYVPRTSWYSGSSVEVRLLKGLPSDTGRRLLTEFSYNFYLSNSSDMISFTSEGMTTKFMSFETAQGASLGLNIGTGVKKPKIIVYKGDTSTLLNNLTYYMQGKTDDYEGYGTYFEKPIDTTKLTLVKDLTQEIGQSQLEFKGESGLYLVAAFDGDKNINNVWVSLSETGIHLRQDDQYVYMAAQNLKTGQTETGISVQFYELADQPKVIATHSLSSLQQYPLEYPQKLDLVVAQKGKETMIIPVSIPNSQAEINVRSNLNQKQEIFLYTDRPLYKKDDTVYFRGIVRTDNDGLYKNARVNKIRVFMSIYNQDKQVYPVDQLVEVKPGGIFSGKFTIPKEVGMYTQYLYASTDLDQKKSYAENYAYFDVFEFVKPDFSLDLTVDKQEYTRGENISATLTGKNLNGTPMSNQQVDVTIYKREYYETEKAVYSKSFNLNSWGGMCGGGFGSGDEWYGEKFKDIQTVTLDAQGQAKIVIDSKELKDPTSNQLTIVAEKYLPNVPKPSVIDDYNKPIDRVVAAKNITVHQGEFNIFFRPGPYTNETDTPFTYAFYAESPSALNFSTDFEYKIYSSDYSGNTTIKNVIKTGKVGLNSEGVGIIKETLSEQKNNYLTLEVSGQDSRNNQVSAVKTFYLNKKADVLARTNIPAKYSNSTPQLKILSAKSNFKKGEKAVLEIESPKQMQVFATFERGRVYKPQWLTLNKGKNSYEFTIEDDFAPSITPTFSFFDQGIYFVEGVSLNVPAMDKLITVEISMDKPKYAPNDTALLTIVTKDAQNNLIPAKIGLSIVDKGIYGLKKNATPPIHSSFYFFRDRKTNSSSNFTWIAQWGGGGGGGGGGDMGTAKDVPTLYWNGELETGSDGRLTVPVPVGTNETTWRAQVYSSTEDSKFGQADLDFLVAL